MESNKKIEKLENKVEELTNSLNQIIERLNTAQIRTVLNFDDLEIYQDQEEDENEENETEEGKLI